MARLFGTDGVRGIANDSLTSGTMLADILAAGIASAGGDCYMVGVIPTPAIAYLTRTHHMDAGVMISASHNPFEYNGIKFFDGFGYKLPDETEDKIEECMLKDERAALQSRPTGAAIGTISTWTDLQQEYADFICKSTDVDLSGLKVVHDGANGSASVLGPEILKRLGAEVIAIHHEPNGININDNCGSTHLESLKETVLKYGADVGIANDGDADRCLAVDEKGQEMDGDQIMLLCAMKLKAEGRLKQNTVVGTVMSNIGFHKALKEMGCQTEITAVGDRYVLEKMRKDGYSLGGEQSGHIIFSKHATTGDGILTSLKVMEVVLEKKQTSGHIIFLDYNTTGDGLLTAVQLLSIMKQQQKPLSELAGLMTRYPQILKNVRVQTKSGWEDNNLIMAAISAGEEELGDEGRILVRPSGTEPLIRVMAEGPDLEQLERIVDDIAVVVEHEMGPSK